MIVVTTNDIPGYRIDAVLGEVMGLTVRSASIGQTFTASFRTIGGGEIPEYTRIMIDSREQVMSRMVDQAARRGANAVIAMPFDTGELAEQMTEVCVHGTAVVVSPIPQGQAGATLQSMDQTRGARR
ncbi:YbjQ family protein [Actinomyces sp. HMSC065F12]|uniref:YbjQ family protein n=1 Tax=Actinomyces sp. HMSC065F12 TaxID=1739479 RepID=UPI0008A24B62|nr:YbjQ family protein [Actinomyces sp. HMSC065F12]OFP70250.1 hypothetical protein HMPREF2975_02895 [Actinomyces sp. HMSC065F12]